MVMVHIPHRRRGKRRPLVALAIITIGLLVSAAVFWVAPNPPMFDPGVTFQQASAKAVAEGKPVLAVVTADYCLQCQMYKRGALLDERVAQWAKEHAEPVMIKWGSDPAAMEALGVTSFPATVLLTPGAAPKILTGAPSAEELLEFLNGAQTPAAPTPAG